MSKPGGCLAESLEDGKEGLSSSLPRRTYVAGPWLELGLELARGEASRLGVDDTCSFGAFKLGMLYPLRLLTIELPLLKAVPGCALHLLLTLSERLSMALCTKPPRPLVGEAGRSMRSGDIRPCEGDIATPLLESGSLPLDETSDAAGSKLGLAKLGIGGLGPSEDDMEVDLVYWYCRMEVPLVESVLEGEIERTLSETGLLCLSGTIADSLGSLDMPGKRILPANDVVLGVISSWFRRYAADPRPRSWVCLNHAGSLEPKESAICSLEISRSPVDDGSALARGDLEVLFSVAICDKGRALGPVDPREVGLCCQESVPDLDGGMAVLEEVSANVAGLTGGWGRTRGAGERFPFDGPSLGLFNMSFEDSPSVAFGWSNATGDFGIPSVMVLPAVDLIEFGVPALEDASLVGEIDLARSRRWSIRCPSAAFTAEWYIDH